MRVESIIEAAPYGPDVQEVLRKAFDAAWADVAGRFTFDEYDAAREILAYSMMSMTRVDTNDVTKLRRAGVRAMQLAYRERFEGNNTGRRSGEEASAGPPASKGKGYPLE